MKKLRDYQEEISKQATEILSKFKIVYLAMQRKDLLIFRVGKWFLY